MTKKTSPPKKEAPKSAKKSPKNENEAYIAEKLEIITEKTEEMIAMDEMLLQEDHHTSLEKHNEVRLLVDLHESCLEIKCPDCRGRFEVDKGDLVEEEIIECDLCAAELEVKSEDPIVLRLFDEESQFA